MARLSIAELSKLYARKLAALMELKKQIAEKRGDKSGVMEYERCR
jgi:hypothetical protein